jgi:ankyrin repeat protein
LITVSSLILDLHHIDVKDDWTRTGLAIAVIAENLELAKLLFKNGANLNQVNINGTTIFMYAKTPVFTSKKTDILECLIKHEANINFLDNFN